MFENNITVILLDTVSYNCAIYIYFIVALMYILWINYVCTLQYYETKFFFFAIYGTAKFIIEKKCDWCCVCLTTRIDGISFNLNSVDTNDSRFFNATVVKNEKWKSFNMITFRRISWKSVSCNPTRSLTMYYILFGI